MGVLLIIAFTLAGFGFIIGLIINRFNSYNKLAILERVYPKQWKNTNTLFDVGFQGLQYQSVPEEIYLRKKKSGTLLYWLRKEYRLRQVKAIIFGLSKIGLGGFVTIFISFRSPIGGLITFGVYLAILTAISYFRIDKEVRTGLTAKDISLVIFLPVLYAKYLLIYYKKPNGRHFFDPKTS